MAKTIPFTEAAAYISKELRLSLAESKRLLSDAPGTVVLDNGLGVTVTMNGDHVMVTSKGLGTVGYLSDDPLLLPRIHPKPLRAWVDNIKNPGKGDAKSGRTPSVDFEVMYNAFRTAPERGEWPIGRGREAAIVRWIAGWRDDEGLPDLGQTQLKKYAGDLMEREEHKGRY